MDQERSRERVAWLLAPCSMDPPLPSPVLLVTHPLFLRHDPGPGHPERVARLRAVLKRLRDDPVPGTLWNDAPRAATIDELRLAHTPEHVEDALARRGRVGVIGDETPLSVESVDAALHAAGAAIEAVEWVCAPPDSQAGVPLDSGPRRAFALVRPPGHHAESDRAMGFCVFNNVAVATAHAIERGLARRVLVIDWDVHHGNGTQEIFWRRDDVLVFSVHESPLYPGSGAASERGAGPGEGFTINVPLRGGSGDAEYRRVFDEVLVPAADAFRPELVMVSAGFDAHAGDPLAHMKLTDAGFAALAQSVAAIADGHAHGRLVACLEGGYDVDALARSVHACVREWA